MLLSNRQSWMTGGIIVVISRSEGGGIDNYWLGGKRKYNKYKIKMGESMIIFMVS
jgi:hypothetical protein